MKCVLIRHGKTAGNLAGRYIGCRTDEPLCPEGIAQLREGRYPAVQRVFASPLTMTSGAIPAARAAHAAAEALTA